MYTMVLHGVGLAVSFHEAYICVSNSGLERFTNLTNILRIQEPQTLDHCRQNGGHKNVKPDPRRYNWPISGLKIEETRAEECRDESRRQEEHCDNSNRSHCIVLA